MHISKLREENAANKANNKAINKIAEDFEKLVAVAKLKELKRYAKSITKLQKNEKHAINNKTDKNWRTIWINI